MHAFLSAPIHHQFQHKGDPLSFSYLLRTLSLLFTPDGVPTFQRGLGEGIQYIHIDGLLFYPGKRKQNLFLLKNLCKRNFLGTPLVASMLL